MTSPTSLPLTPTPRSAAMPDPSVPAPATPPDEPAPTGATGETPDAHDVSPQERAMLAAFDAQRRLALLRIVVPGMLLVVIAALPFAIQADLQTGTLNSSVQMGIGLVGFSIALWATWKRRANLASYALFTGLTGVIVVLLLNDGPLTGSLTLLTIPEFSLLVLPIAAAGIFG